MIDDKIPPRSTPEPAIPSLTDAGHPLKNLPTILAVTAAFLLSACEVTERERSGPFSSLLVADDNSCAMTEEGELNCWGYGDVARLEAPPGLSAVSIGHYHGCGLQEDGAIACWGNVGDRRLEAPHGRFSRVFTGPASFSCALDEQGRATCWGLSTRTLPGTYKTMAIAMSKFCGLRRSGEVDCLSFDIEPPPKFEGRYRDIVAGNAHFCALKVSGEIECRGDNDQGQADPRSGSFRSLSANSQSTCALDEEGRIHCWGRVAEPPDGEFEEVAVGRIHGCARRASGSVLCWGSDAQSQLSGRWSWRRGSRTQPGDVYFASPDGPGR